jgi:hypothetical protein
MTIATSNDTPTISVDKMIEIVTHFRTIPIILKSGKNQVEKIEKLFKASDFQFAYIDLSTVNESIDLILKISMFRERPENKKVVFFFDNFEKADILSVKYLFSQAAYNFDKPTFYKDKDVLLFNTYSSYNNIPTVIMNRAIHLKLD